MKEYNIKVTGLATMLNCSAESINNWYNWKENNQDHELASLLPDYKVVDNTRYWNTDAVYKLAEFMLRIPKGKSKDCMHIKKNITKEN